MTQPYFDLDQALDAFENEELGMVLGIRYIKISFCFVRETQFFRK